MPQLQVHEIVKQGPVVIPQEVQRLVPVPQIQSVEKIVKVPHVQTERIQVVPEAYGNVVSDASDEQVRMHEASDCTVESDYEYSSRLFAVLTPVPVAHKSSQLCAAAFVRRLQTDDGIQIDELGRDQVHTYLRRLLANTQSPSELVLEALLRACKLWDIVPPHRRMRKSSSCCMRKGG